MSTVETFGELITGIYEFMKKCTFVVLDIEVSLWQLFLLGLIGGLVAWFINRFFN